jgi:hypothetical protein
MLLNISGHQRSSAVLSKIVGDVKYGLRGHMVVAKAGVSQTLSRLYCHVEENICEVA